VYIYGGKVTADVNRTSSLIGSGIGGGYARTGNVYIYGGTVVATGKDSGIGNGLSATSNGTYNFTSGNILSKNTSGAITIKGQPLNGSAYGNATLYCVKVLVQNGAGQPVAGAEVTIPISSKGYTYDYTASTNSDGIAYCWAPAVNNQNFTAAHSSEGEGTASANVATGNTNTATISLASASRKVTEKYVDEDGDAIGGDTSTTVANGGDYEKAIPDAFPGYVPVGFRVGDPNAALQKGDHISISGVSQNTTVYLVYHRLNNVLDVVFPSDLAFSAKHTDGGAITSSVYPCENRSDLPLKITFGGMQVVDPGNLRFVESAAADYELHLDLGFWRDANGTDGAAHRIDPNAADGIALGTLGGRYVGGTDASASYLTLGGFFYGPFSASPRRPNLEFAFQFELDG
jgi:hypothetical protein